MRCVCVRGCVICRCDRSVVVGAEKGDKFREWG